MSDTEFLSDTVLSDTDALLTSVEPLPYSRRMRALAVQARRVTSEGRLDGVLDGLSARTDYERRTALHMAMAARHLAFVERVLAGPDMSLRRAALRAVRTLPVRDEAAAAVLDDAPADLRLAFYRTLLHGRRHTLADSLLPEVRARWGDREAAALLTACSAPVVSAELPGLAHAVTAWRSMGTRHPRAVLATAHREAADGVSAHHWWRQRGAALVAAARAEPGLVLEWMVRHEERIHFLPRPLVKALISADPEQFLRLCQRTGWYRGALPPAPARYLRLCSDRELARLAGADTYLLGEMLRALPPGRREAVVDALETPLRGLSGHRLLPYLPADRAAAEARRMLDWYGSVWHSARARLDDPDLPLQLTAHLPYGEAVVPLTEAAYAGDPRRRALARRLLLHCTARTGDHRLLRELLGELAGRSANEQDPLRGAVLTAVAEISPARLDDECEPALDRLFTDAIAARDCSPATRTAVRVLAGRILHHHAPEHAPALTACALRAYERLVARAGADGFGAPDAGPSEQVPAARRRRRTRYTQQRRPETGHRLDLVLRRGQEQDLYELLRPHLAAAAERGDHTLAVVFAQALGRRVRSLPGLQAQLRAAALRAPLEVARTAADLWLSHTPDPAERVVALVEEDPSTVVLPRVWRIVAATRTDRVEALLHADVTGRFAAARTGWLPEVTGATARRWTPGQRSAVLRLLRSAIDDATRPISVRMDAVRSIGRIPGALGVLAECAGREETILAETALGTLGAPGTMAAQAGAAEPVDALSIVLSHADGPIARAASAALAGCCAAVPPSVLGPVLDGALSAPTTKITMRKGIVRQLVRQRPPGAVDRLLRAWNDPALHRDVRIAVAVALRHLPEDPRALRALGDAAGRYASEPMLRTLFQAQPLEYAPADRPGYADLIRRLLTAAEGPGVRFRGSRAFATWARWYRSGYDQIIADVTGHDPAAAQAALPILKALVRESIITNQVIDVVRRLMMAASVGPASPAPAPSTEDEAMAALDTPARDLILSIVTELTNTRRGARISAAKRALTLRVARLLATDPLFLPAAADLRMALLSLQPDQAPASTFADELAMLADHVAGRPLLAAETASKLSRRLQRYQGGTHVDPGFLLPAAQRLVADGRTQSALLALALVRTAGRETSWSTEWCSLLLALRNSPDVEIRHAALEVAVR